MRSLVTSELFRSLPERGVAVIRFNFRGVERSEGSYGDGHGEQLDVVAAIDALDALVARRAARPGRVVVRRRCVALDRRRAARRLVRGRPAAAHPPRRRAAGRRTTPARSGSSSPRTTSSGRPTAPGPSPRTGSTPSWRSIAGGDHFLAGRTDRVDRAHRRVRRQPDHLTHRIDRPTDTGRRTPDRRTPDRRTPGQPTTGPPGARTQPSDARTSAESADRTSAVSGGADGDPGGGQVRLGLGHRVLAEVEDRRRQHRVGPALGDPVDQVMPACRRRPTRSPGCSRRRRPWR